MLTALVALYLIVQSRLFFLKETFVALLYTIGVLLPSMAVTSVELSWAHVGLVVQFFLIAELNLLIFSVFDYDNDKRDQLSSFVTTFGEPVAVTRVKVEFFLLFGISLSHLLVPETFRFQLILLLSSLTLLAIFIFREFFSRHARYRLVGDAVFFYPALILLYEQ